MNLEVKSNLAKLLANENITIQHNNVKTASFDVKNRVLTLPIFKEKSGDVYDMLIAHECAHALWTPYEQWQGIDNAELRSYVNVLEDCRIDLLIQAKYPGVVRNYQNGFDILEKQNFFGIAGKDINKEFMIIDKINLRSKSLQRMPFIFSSEDKSWLAKVDALKTFDDVLVLAKELLDWQKEQVEQMQKLPEFDSHPLIKNYDLGDEDDFDDEDDQQDGDGDGEGNGSDTKESDDEADELNDFNNFGDQKADDEKDSNQSGDNGQSTENIKSNEAKESDRFAKGAGGDGTMKKLKSITDDSYNQKQEELQDKKSKGFRYGNIPTPNLGKDGCLTSWKTFLSDMEKYKVEQLRHYSGAKSYVEYLERDFKKFTKENKKTVMYLVKEFEMKKAATAYKRASTDKTGIIDPLKLPQYQYNEDIFKKLTIIPDGKNHGMMMLLDWSGSMSDVLFNTVKQLINLVEFCRKVNIPFEVYFFTSERNYREEETTKGFTHNNGDWFFENFHLVNCLSHRMNKKQADLALKTMYHMGMYFDDRYSGSWRMRSYDLSADQLAASENYGIPNKYYLGNTPLNESLIYMDKLIPMFRKKYGIEKMTFITLTDGAGNSPRGKIFGSDFDPYDDREYYKQKVYQIGKSKFIGEYQNFTTKLLEHLQKAHKCNVIGFYVVKRIKRWDIEKYINDYKNYGDKISQYNKMRKELTRDKAIAVNADGYSKFFLLDGKKLAVESFDMDNVEIKKGTPSEFKRIFGKSMANRLVSRVVLNKFIKEVA